MTMTANEGVQDTQSCVYLMVPHDWLYSSCECSICGINTVAYINILSFQVSAAGMEGVMHVFLLLDDIGDFEIVAVYLAQADFCFEGQAIITGSDNDDQIRR